MNTARTTVIGSSEIGLETPTEDSAKSANAPINITKVRLSPTEYARLSIQLILWILRTLRIRIPGMKVRKIKPTICLRTGTSAPRTASQTRIKMATVIARQKIKHLLTGQLIGEFTQ